MSIKHTSIFQSKALQNLPKSGFLVWKQTIWQPAPLQFHIYYPVFVVGLAARHILFYHEWIEIWRTHLHWRHLGKTAIRFRLTESCT
jgi:hypothetical protein